MGNTSGADEGRKEHNVPLAEEALELVNDRKGKLFPGYAGQMMEVLNKLRPGYTVHGFRSSFADWQLNTTIGKSCVRWRWLILWATR